MNATHQTIPTAVIARQFTGEDERAGYLAGWAEGMGFPGSIKLVPQGVESYLRDAEPYRAREIDRSNHHTLESAPSFLVIRMTEKADPKRLDIGGWIVVTTEGAWSWWTREQFDERYETLTTTP